MELWKRKRSRKQKTESNINDRKIMNLSAVRGEFVLVCIAVPLNIFSLVNESPMVGNCSFSISITSYSIVFNSSTETIEVRTISQESYLIKEREFKRGKVSAVFHSHQQIKLPTSHGP